MQMSAKDEQIDMIIKKLWSFSDAERKKSIEQLSQTGRAAAKPLIALLSDLVENQHPRFPTGKEEQGQKALERYVKSEESSDRYGGYDIDEESLNEVRRLAINGRLMSDLIYLLGELKAEEAIPVLIKIMENDPNRVAMAALRRMGSAVVPMLIEEVEKAQAGTIYYEHIVIGFKIHIGPTSNEAEQSENDEDDDDGFDEEFKVLVQRRAVGILGDIGDPRALPVLEKLSQTTKDELLILDLQDAISKIRKTNK